MKIKNIKKENRKLMTKRYTLVSLFISSMLCSGSAFAAFDLDEKLTYPPTDQSKKTGPVIGSKPYIAKIKASGPQSANVGNTFTLDFDPLNDDYLFVDEDLDKDISEDNFTWYCFSDPVSLLSDLKTNYPANPATYISTLVANGQATAFERVGDVKGTVLTSSLKSTLTLTQYCAGGIGYVIAAKSDTGYPDESRSNATIIVPSVEITASQNLDGTINYNGTVKPIELVGTINIAVEQGSTDKQAVPPRDMNGKGNIQDNDPSTWPSIGFNVSAENANNAGSYIDLAEALPVWKLTVTKADATTETFEVTNQGKMDEFGILLKSVPSYDSQDSSWNIEIASNQPVKAELTVNFSKGEFTNNDTSISTGNEIGFTFYDQPSESIELKIYERGKNGLGIPTAIGASDTILPDRFYELEIVDTVNFNSDGKPSVVTNYFNDYIRWSYGDDSGAVPAPIHIAGCDSTYQFPTQIDNETRVAAEIKAIALGTLPNYEQGLRLIPSLELPNEIISGDSVLTAIPKADMIICTNK